MSLTKPGTTPANGDGTIGNKTDLVGLPYVLGENSVLGHLNTNYWHAHGEGFVYPNHADNVNIAAGAGAWDLTGALTEIIPADTLTDASFHLHQLNISLISAVSEIQVDIYSGGGGAVLSPWTANDDGTIVGGGLQRSGSYCAQVTNVDSEIAQLITGLSPSTFYNYSGYTKVTAGDTIRVGIRNYNGGGGDTFADQSFVAYTLFGLGFTTGVADTTAVIYFRKTVGGANPAWIDDVSLPAQVINGDFEDGAVAPTLIGSTRAHRNANVSEESSKDIHLPQLCPGTRVSCRLSDSTGGAVNCDVSFEGHYDA
jgi:hypothetical protein